jgi:hypothetical protein
MGKRRRRSRALRPLVALRLLCALVLALFVGQSALAYAAPCGAHEDESGEPCPGEPCPGEDDDNKKCPCPIECASCCMGNATRAVPPSLPSLDPPLPLVVELLYLDAERAPPPSDPAEILHVPKRGRA